MPDGQVLEFSRITKRFGPVTAVSEFSARIEPGLVTGFLGPNGAGKTTSLRMLLGLVRPTSGTATIGGKRYAELKHPLQTVGSALEAASFHPGRSGAGHLKVYANAAGIKSGRVDEVLGLVGLTDAAGRKVGGYSLGMRQRLGLATALLGDPGVLVLDEPANGLDPEGIRWMRGFLRQLAGEGRTVLVSSHVLGEVQQTAESLVIIARGQRVFQGALWELSVGDEQAVVVDAPDRAGLVEALRTAELPYEVLRAGLTLRGADTAQVGAVAASAGVALSSLHKRGPALEDVFLELVNGVRVHPSAQEIAGSLEAGTPSAATEAEAEIESPAEPEPVSAPEAESIAETPAASEVEEASEPEPAADPSAGIEPALEEDAAPEPDAAEPPEQVEQVEHSEASAPLVEPEPEPEERAHDEEGLHDPAPNEAPEHQEPWSDERPEDQETAQETSSGKGASPEDPREDPAHEESAPDEEASTEEAPADEEGEQR